MSFAEQANDLRTVQETSYRLERSLAGTHNTDEAIECVEFEKPTQISKDDDYVNDTTRYQGLMSVKDYEIRRNEAKEEVKKPEQRAAELKERDDKLRETEGADRKQREEDKKRKLKGLLEGGGEEKKQKKDKKDKKKRQKKAVMSFDEDDEED
jgi:hypothetical protein